MPQLDTPSRLTPRSAVRYWPNADRDTRAASDLPETKPTIPVVRRASRLRQPATGDEVPEWKRAQSGSQSTGRGTTTSRLPPKASSAGRPATRARQQALHPLLYLGVGMVVTVSVLAVVVVVSTWVSTALDDLHYGRPRTFQIDASVGHNEAPGMPSHFIALNLHGRLEVIELPGGDPTHARIYLGPQLYGLNADLVPVTLSFKDVHGDHRLDMILHFQGTQVVFLNDGTSFRPAGPVQQQGSP